MTIRRLLIILCVLLSFWMNITTQAQQQEQERPIVKVIYFYPNDRSPQADIDEKLVSQVKQAQKLFGDLMESHGFDRKTFQLEEDVNGDVIVHHRSGTENDADYRDDVFLLWNEFPEASDLSKDFYILFFETDTQRDDLPSLCGLGFNSTEYKGALLPSSGGCFEGVVGVNTIAHELAHGFELAHDDRSDADAQRIYLDSIDTMITSYCAAAWFDGHPAFNTDTTLLNDNTTARMFEPELASPPYNIRLRFEINDPDGFHLVKLLSPTSDGDPKLRDCKVLNGVSDITVEFVTNELPSSTKNIELRMLDVLGNYKRETFNLSDPLPFPPEEDLDVPDPNLAAAIQKQIGTITTHTILNLTELDARNKGIKDLTRLEHARNLTKLTLYHNDISDVSLLSNLTRLRWLYLGHNPISDGSPLSALTGLRALDIGSTNISDISSLKDLKNLEFLGIHSTGISEIPPLAVFKKLRKLYLHNNTISDITSLSALTQLNVLHLSSNTISDISPLTDLTELKELYTRNNTIRDISPLENLTQLSLLELVDNEISNVEPLSNLVNLKELKLHGNPIKNLEPLRALLRKNPTIKIDIPLNLPESVSASAVALLTEASIDENVVTLVLTGGVYDQDIAKIRGAVTVSGIAGVTIKSSEIQRLSDTEVTVELGFDGTDFDKDGTLTFSVAAEAIANYTGDAFTTEISVTARKESMAASAVSPLTETILDGGVVSLILTAATFEQDIAKIRDAVTVSGIDGVTINSSKIQRLNDRKVTVELGFDGTDFVRDRALNFSVDAGAITNHKGTILTAEIPVTASRDESLLTIVWTDASTDKIQRANLDGSDMEDLATRTHGLYNPNGIALDVVGGKMYWTDAFTDKIQRANLDGSDMEDLVTRTHGLYNPNGIALDVVGGKMYWTDAFTDKIQRANLDGSDVEDLVTRTHGLYNPNGIALDVAGGKMYWTDSGWRKIQRANLDGSDVEDLVTYRQGLWQNPIDIALDVAGGKMYWTARKDYAWDKILRANLDGSNVEYLVTQGLESPNGIVLDIEGGKMYWTDSGTNKIQRANLDGSDVEDLVTQGLRNPLGIAIGIITPVNPIIAKEDVNRDGVVDLNDLVIISLRYGQTGNIPADVNGDGVVNVHDLILVAAVIDEAAAAAPAARVQVESHFTETQLQGWLTEAHASGNTSCTYQRGIAVIEQLLALFTPEENALLANYPNPFNPETWIPYQLSEPTDVTLTIYDVKGSVIHTLDLGHQRAGLYQTRSRAAYWDGKNALGEPVASGVYFYTLTTGDFTATRKMLILK